ncbi:hypothetical protein V8F33_006564 [Rhypophila sp. PSN 637]
MAPSTTSPPIDWRMQTIENCKFISRPGAFVSVVTTKEALGEFKAVVIRVIDGQRQPLFSESAATIPEALKALHTRSAEAVQNHVDANGWDFVMPPPNYWGKNETEKDQGETDAESSYSQSASSTVTMSDASDDDMVSVGGHRSRKGKELKSSKKNKKSKTSRKTKGRMGRSRSPSPSRSRSRSRSRSTARSRSRSGSPRRGRSASLSSVTSSSGDEASRASSRPPHTGFRPSHGHPCPPNRMRPGFSPNYPPGWQPSHLHAPPAPVSFPPQGIRGPQLPHPPPSMAPPQFSNMPLAHHIPPPPIFQVYQQQQQGSKDKGPMFGMVGTSQPPMVPGSSQSDNDEGKANASKPNTGYNPFTTVFWPPAPGPTSAPAPAPAQGLSAPHDVLLDIRWPDVLDTNKTHQHRVLEQIPRLSAAVIKESALKYVRREMSKGAAGRENEVTNLPNLCASLRKVGVKGAICHLSDRHSDDLYSLIHDMSSEQSRLTQNRQNRFATFDIEVYAPAGNSTFRGTNISSSSSEAWRGSGPPGGNPPSNAQVPPPPPGWATAGPTGLYMNINQQKKPVTTSMNTHASRCKNEPGSQRSATQQQEAAGNQTFTGVNTAANNGPTSTIPFISPLPPHLQQQYSTPLALQQQANEQRLLHSQQQQQQQHHRQAFLRSQQTTQSQGPANGNAGDGVPQPSGAPDGWRMPTMNMNMNMPVGVPLSMQSAFASGSAAPPPPPPPPPPPMQMQMPFASSGSSSSVNKKKASGQGPTRHHQHNRHSHRGSKKSGSDKVNTPPSVASSVVSTSDASEASSSATTMRFMEENEVYYESDA